MRPKKSKDGWTRSNTGHHFGHFRIRVGTARIDGGPPIYWIYDRSMGCRVGSERRPVPSKDDDLNPQAPIRDLRKAKRLVEKWMNQSEGR